jgi:hypothetical protein
MPIVIVPPIIFLLFTSSGAARREPVLLIVAAFTLHFNLKFRRLVSVWFETCFLKAGPEGPTLIFYGALQY